MRGGYRLSSGQSSTPPASAPPPADGPADGQQLDLFVDGRDALLVHEVTTALARRDIERTEAGLRRLAREHPRHPDLAPLTVLAEALTTAPIAAATHGAVIERIEQTERKLLPAARRFLGADADRFVRPVWEALAATATELPMDVAYPRAHRAWICQQWGDWAQVRAAVENQPGWMDVSLLVYWMGLAQHHLGAPEVAIRLWLPLCWTDPALFEAHASMLPDPTIRGAWTVFEQAFPLEPTLADRAPLTAWFPAWLLLRHRGLARLFCAEDVADAGDAARVFRQLAVLLPLEQGVLTDELVCERRALRALDERFFRHYMAVLGDRARRA